MNCTNCKNPIQDNSYECEWCGNLVSDQSGASIINDAQNLDKSNKNTVKSKNDIFVILGIAAILLFFWVLRKLV